MSRRMCTSRGRGKIGRNGELIRGGPRKFKKISLDTHRFIYHFQENPTYIELTRTIFRAIEKRATSAFTSTLTLLEILVKTIRENNPDAVHEYLFVLNTFPNLKLKPLDERVTASAVLP